MDWRDRIVGLKEPVPLLDGRFVRYVNLDNAATTPALHDAVAAVADLLPFYGSVHRGAGFKSRVSTAAYENARRAVARFVGADADRAAVVFGKNTTEAINKLAHRLPLPPGAVVVTTLLEHHSNDLPWRGRARVVRAGVTDEGRLDEDHFDALLREHGGRVALVAVSGASNVTGNVQPVHRLARKAHAVGARILVDAAQWAPHRRVDVRPAGDPEHLDFVALSAHKLYAPFGTGALVGDRDVFLEGEPEYRGGGTIERVTVDDVTWTAPPDREEAGTPNLLGAVALAAALDALGPALDEIERIEAALTAYALDRLRDVPGLTVYGESAPGAGDRVGVVPFVLDDVPHGLVAAVLGFEAGVGVRDGCFCAQPYVARLLGIAPADWPGRSGGPGFVRVSLGAYNTADDVDVMVEALQRVARREYTGRYERRPDDSYVPVGFLEELRTSARFPPAATPASTAGLH